MTTESRTAIEIRVARCGSQCAGIHCVGQGVVNPWRAPEICLVRGWRESIRGLEVAPDEAFRRSVEDNPVNRAVPNSPEGIRDSLPSLRLERTATGARAPRHPPSG